jgi:phosphate-selective porin
VHFGYAVNHNLELDIRYDTMNRATETDAGERKFTTTTLGAQWFFNLKNRLAINYEIRDAEAPNLPSSDTANKVLGSMENRLSLQITSIF